MAKKKLTAKEKEMLKDLMGRAAAEAKEEFGEFLEREIMQNSPGLHDFARQTVEEIAKSKSAEDLLHPKYGPNNQHNLQCRRCERTTGFGIPMFQYNYEHRCPECATFQYRKTDAEGQRCATCNSEMTFMRELDPGDEVYFDFKCGGCRRYEDNHTKIVKAGGALVRCTDCNTLGALPADNKTVKDFRKKYDVPKHVILGFTLRETQCPRCADKKLQRDFSEPELREVFLVEEDLNDTAQHFKEKGKKAKTTAKTAKTPAKTAKTAKKETKRDQTIEDLAQKASDDFLDEVESAGGFAIRHPGTKTVN